MYAQAGTSTAKQTRNQSVRYSEHYLEYLHYTLTISVERSPIWWSGGQDDSQNDVLEY